MTEDIKRLSDESAAHYQLRLALARHNNKRNELRQRVAADVFELFLRYDGELDSLLAEIRIDVLALMP